MHEFPTSQGRKLRPCLNNLPQSPPSPPLRCFTGNIGYLVLYRMWLRGQVSCDSVHLPSGLVRDAISFRALRAAHQLERDQSSWLGLVRLLPIGNWGNCFPISQFFFLGAESICSKLHRSKLLEPQDGDWLNAMHTMEP